MIHALLPLLLVPIGAGACCAASSAGLAEMNRASTVAIVNVSVIDVDAGLVVPARTVVVEGDRIVRMGPLAKIALPDDARLIDGRGLYLMPGLVDSHIHFLDAPTFGRLMIANGVVLVRDMGMPTEYILDARDRLNRGEFLGPEMAASGTILDGSPPIIPSISIGVGTAEEARAAVRQQAAAGVDMIKVYSRLSRDAFLAILDEAKAVGLKVVGHVPEAVSIEDAAAAGLASSEHFFGFEKVVARLLGGPVRSYYAGMGADASYLMRLGEVDPQPLQEVFDRLRESGLTVCPTVVTFKAGVRAAAFQSGDFPERDVISPIVLETWRTLWSQQADLPEFIWRSWAQMVYGLNEAGVPLMVGTDLSVPGVIPGSSVHEEMAIWQAAGIPAADVLRSATLVPAKFMGLGDRLGSLEEGKTASLLLLRANPLDDVRNAREIEGVFLRGRYFDRDELDRLLEEVRELARE
jgi:imidazolonepropionase-like amidohydrolase